MSKKTVYLAGGMSGISHDEATTWRRYARLRLEAAGYRVLDPTLGKDLDRHGENTDRYTPAEIVEADMRMISDSDIILAEVSREDKQYIGTAMEIRQAYLWDKLIIVWGGSKNYWIRYHAEPLLFDRLGAALGWLELDKGQTVQQRAEERKRKPERSCETCHYWNVERECVYCSAGGAHYCIEHGYVDWTARVSVGAKPEPEDKRTIAEWEKEFKLKILDPDGFDRKDPDLHTRLFTREEFGAGMLASTVDMSAGRNCRTCFHYNPAYISGCNIHQVWRAIECRENDLRDWKRCS